MKHICPVCEKPYTATSRPAFPRHGRKWVVRKGKSGWEHCPGSEQLITEFTKQYVPKPKRGTGEKR